MVLFDVTSASIGAAIVDFRTDSPTVLWSTRSALPLQQELDYERFVRGLFTTFLDVAMRVTTEGVPGVLRTTQLKMHDISIVVVLSPPWFLVLCVSVRFKRNRGAS